MERYLLVYLGPGKNSQNWEWIELLLAYMHKWSMNLFLVVRRYLVVYQVSLNWVKASRYQTDKDGNPILMFCWQPF